MNFIWNVNKIIIYKLCNFRLFVMAKLEKKYVGSLKIFHTDALEHKEDFTDAS